MNPASVRFTMRSQLSGGDLAPFRGRLRNLLSTPVGAARRDMAQAPKQAKPAA